MSIRFGGPNDLDETIETIRNDDALFYKIFSIIHKQEDPKIAYKIIRDRFGYGFLDAKWVIHRIKEIYNENQIEGMLRYTENHNPECLI